MYRILFGTIFLFFSCKETIEPKEDCAGISGGTSTLDDCGVCDANSSNDCQDCSAYFTFNQSTLQAMYFIENVIINGDNAGAEDGVAAFRGDICVGSRKWDTSVCNNNVCDVAVMGDDGNDWTSGYMQSNVIPTFIIHDVSDNLIYNATPDITFPWFNNEMFIITNLVADITSASPCQK